MFEGEGVPNSSVNSSSSPTIEQVELMSGDGAIAVGRAAVEAGTGGGIKGGAEGGKRGGLTIIGGSGAEGA